MTIKVCKQKTRKAMGVIGWCASWCTYISVWIILGFTIYWNTVYYTTEHFNFLHSFQLIVLLLFPITTISVVEIFAGRNGLLGKINTKLKIFEWNNDC